MSASHRRRVRSRLLKSFLFGNSAIGQSTIFLIAPSTTSFTISWIKLSNLAHSSCARSRRSAYCQLWRFFRSIPCSRSDMYFLVSTISPKSIAIVMLEVTIKIRTQFGSTSNVSVYVMREENRDSAVGQTKLNGTLCAAWNAGSKQNEVDSANNEANIKNLIRGSLSVSAVETLRTRVYKLVFYPATSLVSPNKKFTLVK